MEKTESVGMSVLLLEAGTVRVINGERKEGFSGTSEEIFPTFSET